MGFGPTSLSGSLGPAMSAVVVVVVAAAADVVVVVCCGLLAPNFVRVAGSGSVG